MSTRQASSFVSINRRQFITYSALAAGGTALTGYARPGPRRVSPNEKLNIAGVGAGNGSNRRLVQPPVWRGRNRSRPRGSGRQDPRRYSAVKASVTFSYSRTVI